MTITVSGLANAQTMGTWFIRQNQLASLMSSNVVTSDLTSNGSSTTGNVAIYGGLGAVTLATNTLIGGTLSSPNTLYISSNTIYGNGIFQFVAFTANNLGGYANINATLTFSNTSIISGNINFSNSVNVNTALTANNTYISSLYVGNTVIKTVGSNLNISNATNIISNSINISNTSITIGNGTVNNSINSTTYSGTSNNSTNFNGHPYSYYANVTSPVFSVSVNVGTTTINTTSVSTLNVNTNQMIIVGDATVGGNLNVTGTIVAVGNSIASGPYLPQTNNFYSIGNTSLWWGQGFFANLITNQVTMGATTINAASYTGTSNNSLYLGGTLASGYQTTAGLVANVATLTSNNSLYLGGTLASGYQTTAGLVANVATLTSNSATNFGGHIASYYANADIYTGSFNGTTINASSIFSNNGVISNNFNSNNQGQFVAQYGGYGLILRNDGTNFSILSTAAANQNGTWNSFTPFTYNLVSGNVTIDGTGIGTTFGGTVFGKQASFGNSSTTGFNSIIGTSNNWAGVDGTSNSGSGVWGYSNSGSGVNGNANTGRGGLFISNTGVGAQCNSVTNYGLIGYSNSSSGVVGQSNSWMGLQGISNTNYGLYVTSVSGNVAYFGNSSTQFVTIDSSGNINGGNINAITVNANTNIAAGNNGTLGAISLNSGGGGNTGWLAFNTPSGTRIGYIGYGNTTSYLQLENEGGCLGYNFNSIPTISGSNVISITTLPNYTVTYSGANNISTIGYLKASLVNLVPETTSFSLTTSNLGEVLLANSTSTITITVPSLTANGRLIITRGGTGNVNLSNSAGVSLFSRTGNFNILNQYGSVSLLYANSITVIVDGNI